MYHAPVFNHGDIKKAVVSEKYLSALHKKESYGLSLKEYGLNSFQGISNIKKGYYLSMRLGLIYHQCKFKDIA